MKLLAIFIVLLTGLSAQEAEPVLESIALDLPEIAVEQVAVQDDSQDNSLLAFGRRMNKQCEPTPCKKEPAPDCSCLMTNRQLCCKEIFIEAKGAWYYPMSHSFRKVYGEFKGIYALEANFQVSNQWYVYASGGYYFSGGHTHKGGVSHSSHIWFTPVTLGLKYLKHHFAANYLWAWYVGVGGVGTYMQIHNHSPLLRQHIDKFGGGGNAQLGGIWYITKHFLIDIFGQYTYNYIPRGGNTRNLSGVSVGGSLGWTF